MKTDKELLMLAAKALRFNIKSISVDIDDNFDGLFIGNKNTKQKVHWNPILKDGDAIRLAIDLGLRVDVSNHFNCTTVDYFANEEVSLCEYHSHDKHAATRRAIVRAAAAIGEQMK